MSILRPLIVATVGYTLLLRVNGSAIYTGNAQVPVIGIRRARFAPALFRGLADRAPELKPIPEARACMVINSFT
jgi:hypothetical protein